MLYRGLVGGVLCLCFLVIGFLSDRDKPPGRPVTDADRRAEVQRALSEIPLEPDTTPEVEPYVTAHRLGDPVSWILRPGGWARFDGTWNQDQVRVVWDRRDGSVRLWDGHAWKLLGRDAKNVDIPDSSLKSGRPAHQVSQVIIGSKAFVLPGMDDSGLVVWPKD